MDLAKFKEFRPAKSLRLLHQPVTIRLLNATDRNYSVCDASFQPLTVGTYLPRFPHLWRENGTEKFLGALDLYTTVALLSIWHSTCIACRT